MGSSMSLQFITSCKSFPTEDPIAHKWPFPCMPAKMCPKMRCFPIYFTTAFNMADMLFLFSWFIAASIKYKSLLVKVRTISNKGYVNKNNVIKDVTEICKQNKCFDPKIFNSNYGKYLPSPSLQLGHEQATLLNLLPGCTS